MRLRRTLITHSKLRSRFRAPHDHFKSSDQPERVSSRSLQGLQEQPIHRHAARRLTRTAFVLTIGAVAGAAFVQFRLPPYRTLSGVIHRVTPRRPAEISPQYLETDPESLITIRDTSEVRRRREELTRVLWGTSSLPTALPATRPIGVNDARLEDFRPVAQAEAFLVSMEYGLTSQVTLLVPPKAAKRAVILHLGHLDEASAHTPVVTALLSDGFSVALMSMPLTGPNPQPTVMLPRQGQLKLTLHDQFRLLKPSTGHAVKFFVEPIIAVVNELRSRGYTSTSAIGISGGGWTAILAAALDSRIEKTFAVAATYPIYLRSDAARDWGDYEQTVPELLNVANDLELYLLGSVGRGRKQLQIFNEHDSCCFAGVKWQTYSSVVRRRVDQLHGGEFDVVLDRGQRDHDISPQMLARIRTELAPRR